MNPVRQQVNATSEAGAFLLCFAGHRHQNKKVPKRVPFYFLQASKVTGLEGEYKGNALPSLA
jgi:hypothetical protein